jgi:4-methylaminobutanoate oxidase (formaldehyde-forming)
LPCVPELRKPPAKLAKRLLMFTFPGTELFAWGGEPILRNGKPVGELSSVGYSATLACMVGMGFVYSEDIDGAYQSRCPARKCRRRLRSRRPGPSTLQVVLRHQRRLKRQRPRASTSEKVRS